MFLPGYALKDHGESGKGFFGDNAPIQARAMRMLPAG